jgi:glycosyltransferase involved in cell wall biosynthesis
MFEMNGRQHLPSVSTVIPAYNAAEELRQCLECLNSGELRPAETIVVDDGSNDETPAVAQSFGAILVSTGGRRGPAYARNLGARRASGEIVFFVDADVCVHYNTVARVAGRFAADRELDAVIGSYDDAPACPDLLSKYRNLMHCYTHQGASRTASTFWSGCGAVKRNLFLAAGGFDASYLKPAIEDIELGYRLAAAGARIELDRDIQCKHLKRWTLPNMVRTDVMQRAIPWTLLILRAGRMPNDLNLRWHQRVSVALVGLLLIITLLAVGSHGASFLTPLLGAGLLVLGSYWVIEALKKDGRLVRFALAGFLGAFIALASSQALDYLVPPVLVAYVLLFLREGFTRKAKRLRRWSGLAYGAYAGSALLYLIAQMPAAPAVGGFLLLLAAVVGLNLRFYLFLFSRIGNLTGMATVPFHLLYHFYSGLSFALATLQFHYERFQSRRRTIAD